MENIDFPEEIQDFVNAKSGVIFGDWQVVKEFLANHSQEIEDYHVENDARNSAVPLLDLKEINARIEPGALEIKS